MHNLTNKTTTPCKHCGELFTRRAPQQTFCSGRCRVSAFRAAAGITNARNAGRASQAQIHEAKSPRPKPQDAEKNLLIFQRAL
jgi:hypothetical protein